MPPEKKERLGPIFVPPDHSHTMDPYLIAVFIRHAIAQIMDVLFLFQKLLNILAEKRQILRILDPALPHAEQVADDVALKSEYVAHLVGYVR